MSNVTINAVSEGNDKIHVSVIVGGVGIKQVLVRTSPASWRVPDPTALTRPLTPEERTDPRVQAMLDVLEAVGDAARDAMKLAGS